MPYKSKAQQRAMHAKAERGEIDKSVVEEFDAATKKQKGGFAALPEKKKSKDKEKTSMDKVGAYAELLKAAACRLHGKKQGKNTGMKPVRGRATKKALARKPGAPVLNRLMEVVIKTAADYQPAPVQSYPNGPEMDGSTPLPERIMMMNMYQGQHRGRFGAPLYPSLYGRTAFRIPSQPTPQPQAAPQPQAIPQPQAAPQVQRQGTSILGRIADIAGNFNPVVKAVRYGQRVWDKPARLPLDILDQLGPVGSTVSGIGSRVIGD